MWTPVESMQDCCLHSGNRQKSSLKKVYGNKVLNFYIKKTFKTLFSRTFFLVSVFFLQKHPHKKVLLENAWKQRMFTTMEKRGNWYKNTPGRCHIILGKKSQESKSQDFISRTCPRTSENWDFFPKVFISRCYFSETFLHRFMFSNTF